ncbi:MAG: helix-turn-helix domain-containing protein [Alphaproteobacteria bacterium]|nr:helix-turn-helix domain-containing protein [Alphaproteobacteria bacterium]
MMKNPPASEHLSSHHYTECGLGNVFLASGYTVESIGGREVVTIHNVDALHDAIADDIIRNRPLMNGHEARFLRVEMDLSQQMLGQALGVDAQTVARWEKGQTRMSGPVDRIIRLLYLGNRDGDPQIKQLIGRLSGLDELDDHPRIFEKSPDGWRLRQAA